MAALAAADAASATTASKGGATLLAPVLLVHDGIPIEVSVHAAPRAVMRELQHMFSGKKFSLSTRVLALPTSQHTASLQVSGSMLVSSWANTRAW